MVIICADCGNEFVFTADEQEFYASKGYSSPKRCPACRKNRKQQRSVGHHGGRGSRNNFPRQQYDAICSICGCETKVPFEPKEGREIFCKECFAKREQA